MSLLTGTMGVSPSGELRELCMHGESDSSFLELQFPATLAGEHRG